MMRVACGCCCCCGGGGSAAFQHRTMNLHERKWRRRSVVLLDPVQKLKRGSCSFACSTSWNEADAGGAFLRLRD